MTLPECQRDHTKLRILLVGGIYGRSDLLNIVESPETTLERGLRIAGHSVDTWPHRWCPPLGHWDVVHVHHLAKQAVIQAIRPSGRVLVFTRHLTSTLAGQHKAALTLMLKRADGVVTLSETERQVTAQRSLRGRLCVIPNGIDGDQWKFVQRKSTGHGEPWKILFVGQLVQMKRVDTLLDATAILSSKYRMQLRLVYHNDELEHSLQVQVQRLGLDEIVTFIGCKVDRELVEEYEQAHVLVLPSESSEALPSVISEAMLSGLPVIATPIGGISWQLDSNGLLTKSGNPEAIAQALVSVFDNYQDALGRAAHAEIRARNTFTIDSMIQSHMEFYSELLASNR